MARLDRIGANLNAIGPVTSFKIVMARRVRATYTSTVPLKVARTSRAMTKETDRRAVKLAHIRLDRAIWSLTGVPRNGHSVVSDKKVPRTRLTGPDCLVEPSHDGGAAS